MLIIILFAFYRTIYDAIFGYKAPNYKSDKKKLILFFHPFGNRFTNYFIKYIVGNELKTLLPDYHFEEYNYDAVFHNSRYFFVNGILQYFNNNAVSVHNQIKNDIIRIRKDHKYKEICLMGFSMGGIYITSLMEYLQDKTHIVEKIITINSPLVCNLLPDYTLRDKKIDMKHKWVHISDTEYPVNIPNKKNPFDITSYKLNNKPSWFWGGRTYDHFRWLFDVEVYQIISLITTSL